MQRSLSWSEISCSNTCEARHAFQYTGHLTGGKTLKRKAISPTLSNGRAWGAAVAAWHAFPEDLCLFPEYRFAPAKVAAYRALAASYDKDMIEQADRGIFVALDEQARREVWLGEVLDHYMAMAEKLPNLTKLEHELDVPIPSRTGRRASTRYHFQGFLDGFMTDHGQHWVVECKLRTSLTPVSLIQNDRQIRDYAWAHQKATGVPVFGAIVEERLAAAPKPPKIVWDKQRKNRVPSHDKEQLTTGAWYQAVCIEYGVEPKSDVIEALDVRQWQQRVPIIFRREELKEVGLELVSAAQKIRDLDSGARYPVRNTQPYLCRGCHFREACPDPTDMVYLSTIYEFREPKRLRSREETTDDVGSTDTPSVPPANPFERALALT